MEEELEDNTQLEKLEKEEKSSWGGKRSGSGRRPLLDKKELKIVKDLIGQHGSEFDEKTGKERILALMDILYEEGVSKKNISAIKEYLDRQMGRSKESVDITSDGKPLIQVAEEIALKHNILKGIE